MCVWRLLAFPDMKAVTRQAALLSGTKDFKERCFKAIAAVIDNLSTRRLLDGTSEFSEFRVSEMGINRSKAQNDLSQMASPLRSRF
jgi:hypothetical protein